MLTSAWCGPMLVLCMSMRVAQVAMPVVSLIAVSVAVGGGGLCITCAAAGKHAGGSHPNAGGVCT